MTTNEYFKQLLKEISLGLEDDERKMIEEKQNTLREAMREELPLVDDFLTGSYPRHTIIKPNGDEKFDVDVFVAFNNDDYGETDLADLRKMVVSALEKIKKDKPDLGITKIKNTQRRSVCVEFDNDFQIDVVPAIEITEGKLYKIFDKKTLKAVKSNPKLHGALLSEANTTTGEMLVPIIRLLKSWKRDKCDYVKSFHLELLAVEILGNEKIETYAKGMAKFFANASSKLEKACLKDPANNEYYIDTYLDDDKNRKKLLDLVASENKQAQEARELEDSGENDKAVEAWKNIFEDPDLETAKDIESGNFYPGAGGVRIGSDRNNHEERIKSPSSWGI